MRHEAVERHTKKVEVAAPVWIGPLKNTPKRGFAEFDMCDRYK